MSNTAMTQATETLRGHLVAIARGWRKYLQNTYWEESIAVGKRVPLAFVKVQACAPELLIIPSNNNAAFRIRSKFCFDIPERPYYFLRQLYIQPVFGGLLHGNDEDAVMAVDPQIPVRTE
jgi:hypothetical protein